METPGIIPSPTAVSAPVHRIAYVSRATAEFDAVSVERLGHHAAEKNARLGLTGYLFYRAPWFVQYLEGPAPALDEVMKLIQLDQRHHVLQTVALEPLANRLFPDWSMRSAGADHRQMPGWSTRDGGPTDASAVRLEHVLLSVLLHTPQPRLQSASVIEMLESLFSDLANRERSALAQA